MVSLGSDLMKGVQQLESHFKIFPFFLKMNSKLSWILCLAKRAPFTLSDI